MEACLFLPWERQCNSIRRSTTRAWVLGGTEGMNKLLGADLQQPLPHWVSHCKIWESGQRGQEEREREVNRVGNRCYHTTVLCRIYDSAWSQRQERTISSWRLTSCILVPSCCLGCRLYSYPIHSPRGSHISGLPGCAVKTQLCSTIWGDGYCNLSPVQLFKEAEHLAQEGDFCGIPWEETVFHYNPERSGELDLSFFFPV